LRPGEGQEQSAYIFVAAGSPVRFNSLGKERTGVSMPRLLGALAVTAMAGLAACQLPTLSRDIQPVPAATPVPELATAVLAPIRLARVTFNIPRGKQVGVSYEDFMSCGGPYSRPLFWTYDRADSSSRGLVDAFYNELRAAHFNVVGDPSQQFRKDNERADYLIGAEITDMDANICERVVANRLIGRERGESTMDVTWQVFSNRDQRVVYTTKTRGYTKLDDAVAGGDQLVLQRAFAAAAANLAGDKGLVEVLRRDTLTARAEPEPVGDGPLSLARIRLLADPIGRNVPLIQAASVTILIGDAGHGSGFFISDQGHILTNAHVVGNAATVPVRLSNGATITGRVLRRHEARDIALIKIDAVGTRPLAVRLKPAAVSETVYALGTPLDRNLSNTLTRGIVNAVRRFENESALPLIQADVAIQPGNSGGPLLDASGNVVGVAVSKLRDAQGINFFIPIEDALEKLRIEIRS
jgi:serine protease Do